MTRSRLATLLLIATVATPAGAQCASGEALRIDSHLAQYHGPVGLHLPTLLQFPAWDPATHPGGASLVRVELRVTGRLESDCRIENVASQSSASPLWQSFNSTTIDPAPMLGTGEQKVTVKIRDGARLLPFDGLLDFDGVSGESWIGAFDEDVCPPIVIDSPLVLPNWTGSGLVSLQHHGVGHEIALSPIPSVVIQLTSSFGLRVELDYLWCSPGIGTPYCFGDGSGAACPCLNQGAPSAGCANSSGVGATLVAAGSASVAADQLELQAAGLAPGRAALLFAGLNAVAGGSGAPLDDGLRCAGGDVRRLAVLDADAAGVARFGPGLLATGGLQAGETRYFQVWYRDPGGPCGGGSNLSPGVELALTP